jgi:hypothetical protein
MPEEENKETEVIRCKVNLEAIIEHTNLADNVNIHMNVTGKISDESLRKITLDIITYLSNFYQKERRDLKIIGSQKNERFQA